MRWGCWVRAYRYWGATTRRAVAGRTMTGDTDQTQTLPSFLSRRRRHRPPCPTAADMAAAGTAAVGKRKRSSRITLDEGDTEGEFATTDPAITALASGADTPQENHHRRSSNVPPTITPRTGLRRNIAVQLNCAHNVNGAHASPCDSRVATRESVLLTKLRLFTITAVATPEFPIAPRAISPYGSTGVRDGTQALLRSASPLVSWKNVRYHWWPSPCHCITHSSVTRCAASFLAHALPGIHHTADAAAGRHEMKTAAFYLGKFTGNTVGMLRRYRSKLQQVVQEADMPVESVRGV